MKILFVCRANVGRSQMAESIFNSISKDNKAQSAGVDPAEWEGKKLKETIYVSSSLKEIGIYADEKISKKLSEEMVQECDKIIVIGIDKKTWPAYLKSSKKVEYWDIKDPVDGDMNTIRMTRDIIKKKVIILIESLNN